MIRVCYPLWQKFIIRRMIVPVTCIWFGIITKLYERGSLESWAGKLKKKSNNSPLIRQMRRWYEQEAFTRWSCIKQTSPPQIFMARDLLINFSLSPISQFLHISGVLEPVLGTTSFILHLCLCACSRSWASYGAPKQKLWQLSPDCVTRISLTADPSMSCPAECSVFHRCSVVPV